MTYSVSFPCLCWLVVVVGGTRPAEYVGHAFFPGPWLTQDGIVGHRSSCTGEVQRDIVFVTSISLPPDLEVVMVKDKMLPTGQVNEPNSHLLGPKDSARTKPCKYLSWDSYLSGRNQARCPLGGLWRSVRRCSVCDGATRLTVGESPLGRWLLKWPGPSVAVAG